MNFGEKLYELRKEKNLSQEEVAEKLNVTRQTVSKWETNQSTPDFDKIVPLCEFFEITTDELLTGRKAEKIIEEKEEKIEEPLSREEAKRRTAETVSASVFIYIVSFAFVMVAIPVCGMNPIIASAIFLCMIAWATARIIKNHMSVPKFEKTKEEKTEEKIIKQINGIIGTICTAIYFIVSFLTMAWYITWIIFVIDSIICQIVKLCFMLKDEEDKVEK